jgi:O-acetyl-ADP-ribose deacetylase (regulator of RNase III)
MDHAFRLAREHGVRTIAVPAVGTGIAGFPMADCARVMSDCVHRALTNGWQPEEIRFVLFDDAARRVFEESFNAAER